MKKIKITKIHIALVKRLSVIAILNIALLLALFYTESSSGDGSIYLVLGIINLLAVLNYIGYRKEKKMEHRYE